MSSLLVTPFLAHQRGVGFQSKWGSRGGFPGELGAGAQGAEAAGEHKTLQDRRKMGNRETVDCWQRYKKKLQDFCYCFFSVKFCNNVGKVSLGLGMMCVYL